MLCFSREMRLSASTPLLNYPPAQHAILVDQQGALVVRVDDRLNLATEDALELGDGAVRTDRPAAGSFFVIDSKGQELLAGRRC